MTVVVADTSPINYLVLVDAVGILQQLYYRIVIPEEVMAELVDVGAPIKVREWAARHPGWLEVRKAPTLDPFSNELDAGEQSAIALAQLESDVLLFIDETAGRQESSRRGIRSTGTLGVLLQNFEKPGGSAPGGRCEKDHTGSLKGVHARNPVSVSSVVVRAWS